jgi:chitodextrinase
MFVRSAARAVMVLALSLVFADVALAGPPKDRTPPTAPTNFRITAGPVDRTVSFAWNASTDNSSSWWYCVRRSGQGCIRVNPPRTTLTYAVLQPNTTYVFDVIAIDGAGNRSGASNSITFTIPPDTTAPSPPPVVSSNYVRPTRIGVAWTSSSDVFTQVSYRLLVNGVQHGGTFFSQRSLTLLYLTPETTYTFEVIASDAFGNEARSDPLSVTTPPATDTTSPTAPANLRFAPETSAPEAWLDWDPATDNGSSGDLMYEVFVNGVLASSGSIGNTEDIVECTVSGANTFKVRAVDASGNAGPFSNEIVLVC